MSHTHHHHHADDRTTGKEPNGPYWKRAHHDWKFWLAISLMLTAMMTYIVTLDLSVQPDAQNVQRIGQQTP